MSEQPTSRGELRSLNLKSISEVVGAWEAKSACRRSPGFPDVIADVPDEPANTILTEAASHLRSLVKSPARERVWKIVVNR
jgi:hypothetical protein